VIDLLWEALRGMLEAVIVRMLAVWISHLEHLAKD
jgi:hypothetical protein